MAPSCPGRCHRPVGPVRAALGGSPLHHPTPLRFQPPAIAHNYVAWGMRRPPPGRSIETYPPVEEVPVAATSIQPFRVNVRDEELAELRRRIAATRWPSKELVGDRSQGVQLATIQELARYWATDYDWRKCETRLNALPQFKTEIDGVDIHFIHVKSPHADALPLIMTHGWPGSVIELLEVVGPLTDPTSHGGRAEDAFD